MADRPNPPVPADVDLRGLDYMPLFGNHLFGSEFNAAASDSEWRAALTLWWAAWNQVPAGSLPDNDVALCRLADLGRDVKGWERLRERALHGFVLCNDGRLYHAFLCEQALVAWDKRVKERERKAKWRAERDQKKAGRDADVPRDKTRTDGGTKRGRDADVPADGNGRDGTGRDDIYSEAIASGAAAPPATPTDTPPPDPADTIFALGVPLLTAASVSDRNARSMLGLMRKTHGDPAVIDALQRCAEEKPLQPVAWLQAALKAARQPRRGGPTQRATELCRTAAELTGGLMAAKDEHATGDIIDV